jgi:flavin reductase (DIM6/NTAB) family NADH-FMN oxidoreductase RutF
MANQIGPISRIGRVGAVAAFASCQTPLYAATAGSAAAYNQTGKTMDEKTRQGIGAALGRIPSGLWVLTARHEDRRSGILVSWVQQACFQPPMVSVAIAKGRPIMPLISESRHFGLCQIPKGDKVITRKFSGGGDLGEDPFLGFELLPNGVSGVPILAHVMAYLECELTCHMDVEGDHDLFIGQVRAGSYLSGEPYVHIRDTGFRY